MTINTPPPLPTLHANGALSSTERECKWWPDPQVSQKDVQHLDAQLERAGDSQDNKLKAIAGVNHKWVKAARYFLKDFILPTNLSNAGSRPTTNNEGLISAALTRIRDDIVVYQSISGIDEGTSERLNLGHRDVLAAVALLGRLDRTVGTELSVFDPKTFAPPKDKKA